MGPYKGKAYISQIVYLNLLNLLSGIIHLQVLELSIIFFRDINIRTWSWSANSKEPGQTALVAKTNHFQFHQDSGLVYSAINTYMYHVLYSFGIPLDHIIFFIIYQQNYASLYHKWYLKTTLHGSYNRVINGPVTVGAFSKAQSKENVSPSFHG